MPENQSQDAVTTPTRPSELGSEFDAFWDDQKGVKWGDITGALKKERPAELTSEFDAFWDPDKKSVRYDALTGELKQLRSFKAEADVRAQGVPTKPDDYKIAFPPDFKMPEGTKVEIDDKHPLAAPAREWAKKHGLTQEAFAELVGIQAKSQMDLQARFQEAAAEERKKLGANAQERIDAANRALEGRIGKEATEALGTVMFTAAAVEAIEKLIRSTQASYQADGTAVKTAGKLWDQMSPIEKFMDRSAWNKRIGGQEQRG